jgi:hypothetical protein
MNIFKLSIFVFVFVSLITVPGFVLATNDTEIVWFSAKDPNPTTHSVLLGWGARGITRTDHVDLEVICDSGSIKFSTNYNNNPTCEKGGVWSWTGVNTGSITVTPAGNTKPVTVRFHLMIWSGDGTLLGEMNESVTFPATADCSNCVIDGGGYVAPDKINVDYQSIIKNLLEQIRGLQMKLDEKDKDYDQKFTGVVVEPSLPTPPDCYAYASQSLRVGDRSLAVTNVYNLMVKEGLIAENQQDGFWSDGTTLFGERLASAVSKFQEKYYNDILAPYEIDKGTGYVGISTQAKLTQLYGCGNTPKPKQESTHSSLKITYPREATYRSQSIRKIVWEQDYELSDIEVTITDTYGNMFYRTTAKGKEVGEHTKEISPEATNLEDGKYVLSLCEDGVGNLLNQKAFCDSVSFLID